MSLTELSKIYNDSHKNVETVKFGDVQYYILAEVYQTELSLKHWEECQVKYKSEEKELLEEWSQGKIEELKARILGLKETLKLIEKCKI